MDEKASRSGSLGSAMNGVLTNISIGIASKKSFFKGFLGSRGREREISGKGAVSSQNNKSAD